jgi:hypothetical protein
MPRTWDMSGVTEMLSPQGRLSILWDHVWQGHTLLITFDNLAGGKKVEYILYRKGHVILYGPKSQDESELEKKWDDDPAVQEIILNAIVQGAKFQVWDGTIFIKI